MGELADRIRARRDELHQRLYAELDCDQVFADGSHISVGLDAFVADVLRLVAGDAGDRYLFECDRHRNGGAPPDLLDYKMARDLRSLAGELFSEDRP